MGRDPDVPGRTDVVVDIGGRGIEIHQSADRLVVVEAGVTLAVRRARAKARAPKQMLEQSRVMP